MRKEKKYNYIYKTTNLLSGKYYIGMHSTDNLEDGYLGSGTRLRYSINKYGKENHKLEIIEYCDTRDVLKKREEEIVTLNEIAKEECMNLKVGGYGGFVNEEHKNKCHLGGSKWMSEKWKDEIFINDSIKRASNTMAKNHIDGKIKYNTFEGKSHSEETKQLMSDKAKERKSEQNSQYGTCWITNGTENKKIKLEDLETYLGDGWNKGRN